MAEKEAGFGVKIFGCRCYRCGHEWRPDNKDEPPKVCSKCKSPYWDTPKKKKNNHSVANS